MLKDIDRASKMIAGDSKSIYCRLKDMMKASKVVYYCSKMVYCRSKSIFIVPRALRCFPRALIGVPTFGDGGLGNFEGVRGPA